ncbi:hypothetical protein BD410DRAFT_845788 [Rickenella mellea]|uniref:Uncharacterized protein n=1 Tax=Rickenella mellea TaxID=50990 RepID=A0A4Y7PHF9_9AGAM|nr:hypothetical protein BD410DRAFT_845788 [Rickenella mellea]
MGCTFPRLLLLHSHDSDGVIAILATCTSAVLATRCLFHFAECIPPKSGIYDKDAADERLLATIYDQLHVDDVWRGTPPYADWSSRAISYSSNPLRKRRRDAALHILRNTSVLDAVDRYLKHCRASTPLNIQTVSHIVWQLQGCFNGMQWLLWIDPDLISEAEKSLQFLRDPNQRSDDMATDRAECMISLVLFGLRMRKTRKEVWHGNRLIIISFLLSWLMKFQSEHGEHSEFVLETMNCLIGSSPLRQYANYCTYAVVDDAYLEPQLSVNKADLASQAKFISTVKDAVSTVNDVQPFAFPVVEPLIRLWGEFEHPESVALAIEAIDGNQWLVDNKFPLQRTVQELKDVSHPPTFTAKQFLLMVLFQTQNLERSKSTSDDPANNPSNFSGTYRVTASVADAVNEGDGAEIKNDGAVDETDGATGETHGAVGEGDGAADERGGSVGARNGEGDRTAGEIDGAANDSGETSSPTSRH